MSKPATPFQRLDVPPVRSILFVPANREERMLKSLTLDADAVIFDLESAIPRGEATVARDMVRRVVSGHTGARPAIFVRISASTTDEFEDDLRAALHPNLTGILLPQVVDCDDVAAAEEALGRLEPEAGVTPGSTVLVPLAETAQAVRLGYDIAMASPRVAYMGGATSRGGDLARSVGFRVTPEGDESLFLRSKMLIDMRAAGVPNPLSGLWGIIDDLEGVRRLAVQSRNLGYEGMMIIHPSHIAIVNEVFTPSAEQLDEWTRTVEAMEEAEREGLAAIRMDGRLVDVAHVLTAKQELAKAARLGVI